MESCLKQENQEAKEELKKLLSHASHKDLLVPTQKDMSVREYIKKYNEKCLSINMSSIANNEPTGSIKDQLTDIDEPPSSKQLDSFRQEFGEMKDFISHIESKPESTEKSLENSLEIESPSKVSNTNSSEWNIAKAFETEKRHRLIFDNDESPFSNQKNSSLRISKHKFAAERSPNTRFSQTMKINKNIQSSTRFKKNKYLMNLEKKFNPANARFQTRTINLFDETENQPKSKV